MAVGERANVGVIVGVYVCVSAGILVHFGVWVGAVVGTRVYAGDGLAIGLSRVAVSF